MFFTYYLASFSNTDFVSSSVRGLILRPADPVSFYFATWPINITQCLLIFPFSVLHVVLERDPACRQGVGGADVHCHSYPAFMGCYKQLEHPCMQLDRDLMNSAKEK